MATHDLQGRAYKLMAETKAGDIVSVDADFECIKSWDTRAVYADDEGKLWIPCKSGKHYLDGQEDQRDGTDALIGIYPA